MPNSSIADAVFARAQTYWTATPLYEENDVYEPPVDGGAFMVVEFPYGRESMMSIGSPGDNNFKAECAVRFVLFIQTGGKTSYWRGVMSSFLANFRVKVFDGVRTMAPTTPVRNPEPTGRYYELSASVPFEYRLVG